MKDLIDTHAHLAHKDLVINIDDLLIDAGNAGVGDIISIGCTVEEADKSLELSYIYPNVYSTAGLYPHGAHNEEQSLEEQFERISYLAAEPKVVAVGECGFDFKKPSPVEAERTKPEQEDLFRKQIELARVNDKPVVIHSREATQDTIRVLEEEYSSSPFQAVWHCFTEDIQTAEKLLKMEMLISITGIITYSNANDLREVVKLVPLDKIMLETDSPYLAPQQIKSEGNNTNKPEYIKYIAEEVATIKGISLEAVAETTSTTAQQFFKF